MPPLPGLTRGCAAYNERFQEQNRPPFENGERCAGFHETQSRDRGESGQAAVRLAAKMPREAWLNAEKLNV
jgi:hypothetical protein